MMMGYFVPAFIMAWLILFLGLAVYLFALLMMSVMPTKRKRAS